MNFAFSHDFDIDADSYWKMFFSPEFFKQMYTDLKMKKFDIAKLEDDGKLFVREVKLEPANAVPGWMQSIVKGTGYLEKNRMVWGTNSMEVIIETDMFKDRFHMKGTYSLTPLGPAKCRRDFKGEVKVSIPLVGGRIEKYMMEQIRDSYDAVAATTRKWIADKKANP
jgi:hypothetical protein